MKFMVEAILVAARVRREQVSDMIGGREGGLEGVSKDRKGSWLGWEHRYSGTETGDTKVGV